MPVRHDLQQFLQLTMPQCRKLCIASIWPPCYYRVSSKLWPSIGTYTIVGELICHVAIGWCLNFECGNVLGLHL